MNTYTQKKNQSSNSLQRIDKQNASNQLRDNSSESVFQRRIQERINNSSHVKQLQAFQEMANNSPQAQEIAQLQTMINNSSHAKQLQAFQEMANNSPQAQEIAQLQTMINNSSHVEQLQAFQEMANNHAIENALPLQKKENKTGLPDNLKSGIESLSGYSMDDVSVHYNSNQPAQLNAHAYAQGTDIHIASGQEKHLPHEAWHVVQQKQGRVKPTMQMKGGVNVNDDKSLEKEADVMGGKAIRIQPENKENIQLASLTATKQMQTTQLILKEGDRVSLLLEAHKLEFFNKTQEFRNFFFDNVQRYLVFEFDNLEDAKQLLIAWHETISVEDDEENWKQKWRVAKTNANPESLVNKIASKAGKKISPQAPLPADVMHRIGSFLDDKSLINLESLSKDMREWSLDEQLGSNFGAVDFKGEDMSEEEHRAISHAAYKKARMTPEVLLYRVPDKHKRNIKKGSKEWHMTVSSVSAEFPWGRTPAWIQGAVRRGAKFTLLSDPTEKDKLVGGVNPKEGEDSVLTRELRQILLHFGYTINKVKDVFELLPPDNLPEKLLEEMDWEQTWDKNQPRIGSFEKGNNREAIIEKFQDKK